MGKYIKTLHEHNENLRNFKFIKGHDVMRCNCETCKKYRVLHLDPKTSPSYSMSMPFWIDSLRTNCETGVYDPNTKVVCTCYNPETGEIITSLNRGNEYG